MSPARNPPLPVPRAALAGAGCYGAVDGLLLSAFPILAVFAAAEGSKLRRRRLGTVAVGAAAALLASSVITTVYHLGYRDFRSAMLVRPVAADLVWSVPTLVTLNPIGTPITPDQSRSGHLCGLGPETDWVRNLRAGPA